MRYIIVAAALLVLAACGPVDQTPDNQTPPEGLLPAGCDPAFADAEACTLQYDPVCATMTDGTQETVGNECVACAQTEGVVSITSGECPE